MLAAVCLLMACAPAAWACPGCTEGNVITLQMSIAAHALAIWTTVFVLFWYGSEKNPPAKMLRLVVAAGFLASAMPVSTIWLLVLVPIPLSWGTVVGFPFLLIKASRERKAEKDSPFPGTAMKCLLGLVLGVLAVQTAPIINELIQWPQFSYGREYGDRSSVVLLFCRPIPLVVLVLVYWYQSRHRSKPLIMCMLLLMAALSAWLSFPLRELNGYAWFAGSGMVAKNSFSAQLLPLFRFLAPVLCLIPLVYGALCFRFRDEFGLSPKTLRVVVIVGAIAGVLALTASLLPTTDNGARGRTRIISDSGNLKQIGLALRMYSAENSENYPPDLGMLFDQGYLTSGKTCVSPKSSTLPPASGDDIRAGRCDYIYFGTGHTEKNCTVDMPLATTKPDAVNAVSVYVLYGDGHVKGYSVPPSDVKALWNDIPSDQAQSGAHRK